MRRAALAELEACRAHLTADFNAPAADHILSLERKFGLLTSAGATEEDVNLREAARLSIEKYRAGGRGLSTGLATLDGMIAGLFPEDLIIIAGRPSMGKTALADNIAHSVAGRGLVVAFWSGEMAAEQIAERALSRASYGQEGAFQYRAFRRRELPVQFATSLVEKIPDTLVINRRGAITLERLRAFCRRARRQYRRLDLIVVDYLQLMRDEMVKHGEVAQVTAITAGLKGIAKDFSVPVIALSQLSRELEKRDEKRPKLADLRQSGSIEQDADIVLFVYREQYYLERDEPRPRAGEASDEFSIRHARWSQRIIETTGKVEIIASKARHDAIGSQWLDVELGFDLVSDIEAGA
jgi:replicative DNA helicase